MSLVEEFDIPAGSGGAGSNEQDGEEALSLIGGAPAGRGGPAIYMPLRCRTVGSRPRGGRGAAQRARAAHLFPAVGRCLSPIRSRRPAPHPPQASWTCWPTMTR